MITNGAHRKRQAGQAFTELALLLPVMLVLTMGIIDFARVFYFDVVAINAARSGARIAADSRKSDTDVNAAVLRDAPSSVLAATINIAPTISAPEIMRKPGTDVKVTVRYDFSVITPVVKAFIPGGTITVARSATMVVY